MSSDDAAGHTQLSEMEIEAAFEQLMQARNLLGPLSAARYELVDKLERIEESRLGSLMNEHCSICYNSFAAIIAEEEMLLANDTPVSERDLGVTKLQTCGHYFCRKDISKWILEGNDACPYCRVSYLPESARNQAETSNAAAVLGAAGGNTDGAGVSLTSVMEQLEERWRAAAVSGRASQRPGEANSGMYS